MMLSTGSDRSPCDILIRGQGALSWDDEGYPRKAGHSRDCGIASVRATPRYRSAGHVCVTRRWSGDSIPWQGFALHPPGSALPGPTFLYATRFPFFSVLSRLAWIPDDERRGAADGGKLAPQARVMPMGADHSPKKPNDYRPTIFGVKKRSRDAFGVRETGWRAMMPKFRWRKALGSGRPVEGR